MLGDRSKFFFNTPNQALTYLVVVAFFDVFYVFFFFADDVFVFSFSLSLFVVSAVVCEFVFCLRLQEKIFQMLKAAYLF